MPSPEFIHGQTERRSESIYRQRAFFQSPARLHKLLADPEPALALKFTAVLAAFASLACPLRLADFRAFIPDDFWQEHCQFYYVGALGGWVPIGWEIGDEWFYSLGIGPRQSPYGIHSVYFTASRALLPDDPFHGPFHPPLDTVVSRFTLCHPFLQPEMHDGSGIYLFTGA